MAISPNLPAVCFMVHPISGDAVMIRCGVMGYTLTEVRTDDTAAWVDQANAELGVTEAQREAMFAGSMFGWHLPIADPAKHRIA